MTTVQKWLVGILVAFLLMFAIGFLVILPNAFNMEWQFWASKETPVAEASVAEIPVVETPVAEAPVVETPVVETPVAEAPDTELVLTFSDGDIYTYSPKLWEMGFGDVWGIQMTGKGFEKIDTLNSTAEIIIPNGYYAILNVDGMGNYKGTAELNGQIVDFDKGNPTFIGNSVIIPPNVTLNIPFAGNDSSGALLVLSEDINLLQAYINNK